MMWSGLVALLLLGTAQAADLPRSESAAAPALADAGSHASPQTLASSPARWGLGADDFSVLEDAALVRKANVPGHRAALEAAAREGDAYAQFLVASHPGEADDAQLMQRAARQGLVRAIADANVDAALEPGAKGATALTELERAAALGNAHAKFLLSMVLSERERRSGKPLSSEEWRLAATSLEDAIQLGYAPAQFVRGRDLLQSSQLYDRALGRTFLRKAAAQGLAEAQAMLDSLPK